MTTTERVTTAPAHDEVRGSRAAPSGDGTGGYEIVEQRLLAVSLRSVLIVSAIVGALTAAMAFIAGLLVWQLGDGAGLIDRTEELVSTVSSNGAFEIQGGTLLAWWTLLAVLWTFVLTAIGVVIGVFINAACALSGGLRIDSRIRRKPRS